MANLTLQSSLPTLYAEGRHSARRNPLGTFFNTLTHRHKHMKVQESKGKENKAGVSKQSKSSAVLPLTKNFVYIDKTHISPKVEITREREISESREALKRSRESYSGLPSSKEQSSVQLIRVQDIGGSSANSTVGEEARSHLEEEEVVENEDEQETVDDTLLPDEEENMIEARKHFLAPANPPPPVPLVKTTPPLRTLNGGMNMSSSSSLSTNLLAKTEPLKLESLKQASVSGVSSSYQNGASAKPIGDLSKSGRSLQLNGNVGFESLPHQLVRKCTEQGFQFNLMCVGETGTGKSTLIESLFNMKLEFPPCNNELKTVELHSKTYDVTEGGIHLKLTIAETAGFGDQLDKDKSAEVIVNYINEQFERYLKEELKIKRCLEYYNDTRIHACLYFISPTGHGLKALDVVTMRRLSERVNVIPVIAKADTACKDELVRFKSKILSELRSHNIPIYQFPTDDETVRAVNTELNQLIPYAVVGSIDFVKKENGKLVRARRYPWGIVEVENEQHCDFVKLREAVLRTNVDALRERTHKVLYEDYRRERLRAMKVGDGDTGPKMLEAYAQKQKEFASEMEVKEKAMREEFVARVNRKEEEMKRREELLNMKAKEIKDNFEEELKRLESQMNILLEEKMKLETKAGKKVRK